MNVPRAIRKKSSEPLSRVPIETNIMNSHQATTSLSVKPSSSPQRRALLWLQPGLEIKRWIILFMICTLIGAAGFLHFTWTGPLHPFATKWILFLNQFVNPELLPLHVIGIVIMMLTLFGALTSIFMLNRTILRAAGQATEKVSHMADMLLEKHTLSRGSKIVAVGGGTGLSNLLTGLKEHSSNITAIVTVADDGGSSGRLRRSLDMIAPGDLTDCYAALSDSPVLARLLLRRFKRGEGIEGHTFGNLMLATLSEEQGGLGTAMQDIHEVLNVRGEVFPATTRAVNLVATLCDGRKIHGESQFAAQLGTAKIQEVQLDPPNMPALPQVIKAINNAELIVLGPGSLFTSIIPPLLVPEIAQAMRNTIAPIVYVASIMTEPGETNDLTLSDHVDAITKHLGRTPDLVLMNNAPIDKDVQTLYRRETAQVIDLDGADQDLRWRVRTAPLVRPGSARHDPEALAASLLKLSQKQK